MEKLTLNELFDQAVAKYRDKIALAYTENKALKEMTFVRWKEIAESCARALASLGVRKGDRVAMISEKCYEMPIMFFAIWKCNAVAVPVCETLTEESQAFILKNAQAKLALTSDRFRGRIDRLAEWVDCVDKVISYKELMSMEVDQPPQNGDPRPEDLAILVYTSGSTGHPKGVMLSHNNMTVNARDAILFLNVHGGCAASLLPYWHCFALSTEMFCPLVVAMRVFVPRDKLDFQRHIKNARPTIILSVPRIAETIRSAILKKAQDGPAWKNRVLLKAIELNGKRREGRLALHQMPLRILLDRLILSKVRAGFGGRVQVFVGGGAPLDKELQDFFMDINMPMMQGYGLTEASPVVSANTVRQHRLGTSGRILPWLQEAGGGDFTFETEDGKRGKNLTGELLLKGDCVMMGYWNDPEETRKAIEPDGWLHTKDIGYLGEEGYLMLHGRRSSLVCLKNGEKFYPEVIEERIKLSPYITQAVVVGEGQAHCYAVLNVDEQLLNGQPDEVRNALLKSDVDRLCAHLEKHMRPKDVMVLPEFTQENGLLTATLKVRRHKVLDVFSGEMDRLFGEQQQLVEALTV